MLLTAPLDVELAAIAGRPVSVGVDPPSQRLDGRHDLVHGATVYDRRRLLDLGQIHDREVVFAAGLGADRKAGVDEHPVAIRAVLVVGDRRAGRSQTSSIEPAAELYVERADDRTDRLRLEAGCGAGELREPDSRYALDVDVIGRHCALLFDDPEPRFD